MEVVALDWVANHHDEADKRGGYGRGHRPRVGGQQPGGHGDRAGTECQRQDVMVWRPTGGLAPPAEDGDGEQCGQADDHRRSMLR